jgi:hypothetical protein
LKGNIRGKVKLIVYPKKPGLKIRYRLKSGIRIQPARLVDLNGIITGHKTRKYTKYQE